MAGTIDAGEIVHKPLDEFVIYLPPPANQQHTGPLPSTISGLYAKSVARRNVRISSRSRRKFLLHGPRAQEGR
jgi:hypothetical protein